MSVIAGRTAADFGLQPVMTFATRLLAVNRIGKGERIGYSATWETPEDTRIGVAAVRNGDGSPRHAPAGLPEPVHCAAVTEVDPSSRARRHCDMGRPSYTPLGDPGAQVGSWIAV